ncbi:hypothetical protein [Flagellimonas flava]|uniref:hypothetical protein n=1 Tax=Flagellimonas flava TaxID=570519 RepID=UPI003D655C76
MVEESVRPIDEFIRQHGKAVEMNVKQEFLETVAGAIDVNVHTLNTNYLNKRSYSKYKIKGAVIIGKNFLESHKTIELSNQRKEENETNENSKGDKA